VTEVLDTIAVGTVYNLFHEEYASDAEFFAQADADLAAMKEAGITHVLLFPMNQWDPATRTRLWTRTDHVVARIEALGLKFVPLLLKEEQCGHYLPVWEYLRNPSLLRAHLRPDGGRNTRENADFADPSVYPLVEDSIAAVAGRYGRSPALAFYNLWNEPHYSSGAPHVVDRFRDWLRARYGSLAALGRAWGEDYSSWDEVSPYLNDDWNSSMPAIDWRLFRGELNGQLLGQLAATLRKYDPVHAVNANPVGAAWTGGEPGGYNTYNWQFTAHNDFNGLSYYPEGWELAQPGEEAPLWLHNLSFNVVRCAAGEKGYLLTELYTNAKNGLSLFGYLDRPSMTRLSWCALANNAKGLFYWKWEPFLRGRQSLGRGLTGLDGRLAPRGEAVRDLARVLHAHGPLLLQARPVEAAIGILLDQRGLLKVLDQPNDPRTRTFMTESLAGLHRSLDEANLPVDLLRTDLPLDAGSLRRYRVLFLPFQVVVSRETARLLRDYVHAGGTLVADARSASIDEIDIAYRRSPGAGLDEVFGATRRDWSAAPVLHPVHLSAEGRFGSVDFAGRWFREQLEPFPDTEIIGRFSDTGEPALLLHLYGAGRALLSAVPLGASYQEQGGNPVALLLQRICQQAGVRPPARFMSRTGVTPSLRVHRTTDGSLLVYVLNPGREALSGRLVLEEPQQGEGPVRSLLSDQVQASKRDPDSCSVDLDLPGRGVELLLFPSIDRKAETDSGTHN
jgi:beta-galactosidase GanA